MIRFKLKILHVLCLLLECFVLPVYAQNLIPNPSFEDHDGCPNIVGAVNLLDFWYTPVDHAGSADLFDSCSTIGTQDGWYNIPNNGFGYQVPEYGSNYIGMSIGLQSSTLKEYASVGLTDSLESKATYEITLFYSKADESLDSIKPFGVHFSIDSAHMDYVNYEEQEYLKSTPQVLYNEYFSDTAGWSSVKLNYLSSGGEKHMTFGSFKPNYLSDYVQGEFVDGFYKGDYVYFDSVSLVKCIPSIPLEDSFQLCFWDTLYIDIPVIDSVDYQWSTGDVGGNTMITEAGIYYLEVSTDRCSSRIEFEVNFNKLGCEKVEMPNVFTPNNDGVNDFYTPITFLTQHEFEFSIYNRWGNLMYQSSDEINWNGDNAPEGTYFWILKIPGRGLEEHGFLELLR